MPKPVNLADMLWNRAEAQGASPAGASSPRGAAKKGQPAADLAARGFQAPPDAGATGSFQQRVKESRAKLEKHLDKQGHRFFPKPDRAPAHAPDPQKPQAARSAPDTQAPRTQEGPAKAETAHDGAAPTRRRDDAAAADKPVRKAPENGQAQGRTGQPAAATPENVPADAADAAAAAVEPVEPVTAEELKAALKQMGIEITDDQLNDPAFLAQMLSLVQSFLPIEVGEAGEGEAVAALPEAIPAVDAADSGETQAQAPAAAPVQAAAPEAEAAPEAAPSAGPAAAAKILPAAAPAAEASRPAADAAAPAAVPSAEDVEAPAAAHPGLEKLETLIRGRLAALAEETAGASKTAQAAPPEAALRNPWRIAPAFAPEAAVEVTARPLAERPAGGDAPMIDPDRLRVLQASGFDLEAPAREAAAEGSDEADVSETAYGFKPSASEADADGGAGSENRSGLFGRDAAGQPGFSHRETAAAPKDAGTVFHAAIDQARAPEARAAETRPAAPQHVPAQDMAVLQQIARKLSLLGRRGNEEISIQLTPENLGKVRINLEMREGALSARIAVENDEVRKLVDANLASLRGSLEDQGIKLQGLEVSVDQRQGSLFNPDGRNAEEFFRARGGEAPTGEAAEAADPEAETGRRLGYNTMEFIG